MPTHVRHQLHPQAIQALLASPQGGLAKDLFTRGLRVQAAARRFISGSGPGHPKRVDTGQLRNSVSVQLVSVDGLPAVRVGTKLGYARWVHDGTGVYGPRHAPIRPRQAKVLVFKSKQFGAKKGKFRGKVVVRQVKGIPGNPFLRDALKFAKN